MSRQKVDPVTCKRWMFVDSSELISSLCHRAQDQASMQLSEMEEEMDQRIQATERKTREQVGQTPTPHDTHTRPSVGAFKCTQSHDIRDCMVLQTSCYGVCVSPVISRVRLFSSSLMSNKHAQLCISLLVPVQCMPADLTALWIMSRG